MGLGPLRLHRARAAKQAAEMDAKARKQAEKATAVIEAGQPVPPAATEPPDHSDKRPRR